LNTKLQGLLEKELLGEKLKLDDAKTSDGAKTDIKNNQIPALEATLLETKKAMGIATMMVSQMRFLYYKLGDLHTILSQEKAKLAEDKKKTQFNITEATGKITIQNSEGKYLGPVDPTDDNDWSVT